ncbi:MAG TPA: CinA family protein [Rhodocyclaceae bacterium]|nr:CinA family protein [Rhodocyclaceae bacterium]
MSSSASPAAAATAEALAARLGEALLARGQSVATAESCTGGGVATALTAIAGSSRWFERGFVTYSNEAKQEMLGVSAATLERDGAVSAATVTEMAAGALRHSRADWALAISGIAGPDGGTPAKPVGTVWLAWAGPQGIRHCEQHLYPGDRRAVREQAGQRAIEGLLELLQNCI